MGDLTHRCRLVLAAGGGPAFWASIAPFERPGGRGVDRRLNALCFESLDGDWIGSTPLYHNVTLDSLSEADLLDLFDQAISRG